MATFTYIPDWGASPELTPSIKKAGFGDGYEQRAENGLTPYLPTWNLQFSRRTETEAKAIAAWLQTNKAATVPFQWAPPGFGTATDEVFGTADGSRVAWQLIGGGLVVTDVAVGTIYRDGAALVAGVDYTINGAGLVTFNPSSASFAAEPFGTGNGSATTFTLKAHGVNLPGGTAPTVTAIHRTDWQGRQLLYPTARTNLVPLSSPSAGATGYAFAGTAPTNVTGPDGAMSAVQFAPTTGVCDCFAPLTASEQAPGNYNVSCWIYPFEINSVSFLQIDNSSYAQVGPGTLQLPNLTPGVWQKISVSTTNPSSQRLRPAIRIGSGKTCKVGAFQLEPGSATTSHIPTTTAPATVTDYTLSDVTATFAVAPVSGAALDWDGSATTAAPLAGSVLTWTGNYTFKFIADKWNPAKPDDFNSWSTTAVFRQVMG